MSNNLIVIKFVAKHKERNLKLAVLSFVKIVLITSMRPPEELVGSI